jgi:hypothetical protein
MSSTTRTDETATTDHGTAHAVPAVPESTDPTAATTSRTETEDKLLETLRANPNSTAADLSTDAGIGRSTAAKILVRWANGGSVTRTSGIAEGGRRGTVNLLKLSAVWAWLDRAGRSAWPVSGRCGRAGDLVPRGESVGHFASVFLGTEPVAAWPEVWGDAAEGGQEPLGVPG